MPKTRPRPPSCAGLPAGSDLAPGYDRLVLVAPSDSLAVLRGALGGAASGRITAERAKDLTWMEPAEVCRHIADIVAC